MYLSKLLLLSFSFLVFSYVKATAQSDSTTTSGRKLKLSVHNGISFIQNSTIREGYSTKAVYNYGIGLRFGNPEEQKLLPYFDFSNAKYTKRKETAFQQQDTVLRNTSFAAGLILPIKLSPKDFLRFNYAALRGKYRDEKSAINNNFWGMRLGIGYEAKIKKNFRCYVEALYDFKKLTSNKEYSHDINNVDFLSLNFGLYL